MPKSPPTLHYELPLWSAGFLAVAGIDEAGRGCWAGPVTAGAVILPPDPAILETLSGVRDSKLMTPAERDAMADLIPTAARAWAVGEADNAEIDRLGILNATRLAMKRAIDALPLRPDHLLIDYVRLHDVTIPQIGIAHGDRISLSIAAASVIAKVTRDREMESLAEQYPAYGFEKHKGYGTKQHQEALARFGPTPLHRLSFKPLASEEPTLF